MNTLENAFEDYRSDQKLPVDLFHESTDTPESDQEPTLLDEVKNQMHEGFEASKKGGFRHLKIKLEDGSWKELGIFLATDLFRMPLSMEEKTELIEYGTQLSESYRVDSKSQGIGGVALGQSLPSVAVPKPHYPTRENKSYENADWAERAAHDYDPDE